MHIALVCPEWPLNESTNGIVTYVHHLRLGLMQLGHRVSVFTGRVGRTSTDSAIHLVEANRKHKIRIAVNRLTSRALPDVYYWGRIIADKINSVHRIDPIDVVELGESFGLCADVKKHVPMPVVVKLHGPAFLSLVEEELLGDLARFKIETEGKALREIATIIAPSKSTYSRTASYYGLTPRIHQVIPNPVMLGPGAPSWDLDHCDKKTLLFVGRFDKRKGADTMLLAFRRLLEIDSGLKLIFVGPDTGLTGAGGSRVFMEEFRDALFTAAQKSNVRYLGALPNAEVLDLRTKALVTLVTSRWESQGYTAIEAMAQGCPVIVSNTDGLNEIVEHDVTGLLTRPQDVDHLGQNIMSLVNEPMNARRLGQNAREMVRDRFSVRKLAGETVEVYRSTISSL